MTEEKEKAIEKIYEEGLVNVSKIAEPLINKYKELDYQQCQFVIEYLLADRQFDEEYVDKLEADIEIKDKVIEEIKSKLQKHINFCEQESRGHLENKVCHISLKFEKNLLEEVEKIGGEDDI